MTTQSELHQAGVAVLDAGQRLANLRASAVVDDTEPVIDELIDEHPASVARDAVTEVLDT
jgi:hypothetical protein